MNTYENLKVGTEIYYTGDMVNSPAKGKIIAVRSDKFYPVIYDFEMKIVNADEDITDVVIWKGIFPVQFDGVGKRFWVMSEYQANRKKQMEEFEARYNNVLNK